jgi:type I restriction enzyme S subunit
MKLRFKQTEVGAIPEDWEVTTVGAEFSIQLGKMLDSEKNVGVPKPYLGNRAVQWGRIDLTDVGEVKLTPVDVQRFRLRDGDILVCEGGEVGRAAIWRQSLDECYYQKALHRLRPKNGYNIELLVNILQRLATNGVLANFVTQTSIAHLPKDKFETVPIPAPSTKAEQEAIAEALSDADALIESFEQLIAKKRHIKQGAMQEFLTGKRRLPGFKSDLGYKQSEVGTIPNDWKLQRLGDLLARAPSYGINASAIPFDPRHPTYLRITDISDDGRFIAESKASVKHVLAANYLLNDGDLVFARTGASVGKSYLYDRLDGELVFAGFLIRVQPDPVKLEPGYLKYFTHSSSYWGWIKVNSMRSGQPGINGQEYASLPIPLPPTVAEQKCIAIVLSVMEAEIALLETKLSKTRAIKQGMMQELLTGRIRLV